MKIAKTKFDTIRYILNTYELGLVGICPQSYIWDSSPKQFVCISEQIKIIILFI